MATYELQSYDTAMPDRGWTTVTAETAVYKTRGQFSTITAAIAAYERAINFKAWQDRYRFRVIERASGVIVHGHGAKGDFATETTASSTYTYTVDLLNTTAAPAAKPKEKTMQLSSKLTVKKETLEKKIQAKLDEKRTAWEQAQQERKDKRARRMENFLAMLGANADAVLIQIDNGYEDEDEGENLNAVTELLDKLDRNEITLDLALAQVKEWSGYGEGGKFIPNREAEKLLSVLQAAEDKTLEITTDDDLYEYL
jgi:hypothetical protein